MNGIESLLLSPATPFATFSLAGVCLAAMGLVGIERRRRALAGFRALPGRIGMAGRLALGQAAAIHLALLVVLLTLATGTGGSTRALLLAGAAALYLYLGVVLPRRPLVERQRRARTLRKLTPSFVAYVRVSLEGYDSPRALLERFVERPLPRKEAIQELVRESLALQDERLMTPFAALLTVARERGCVELRDVAEQLAQSERDGTSPLAALAAFERTIQAILRDEFQRMLKRRMLYLMAMVGVSLVVGILGNLLYVMTAGGQIFMRA